MTDFVLPTHAGTASAGYAAAASGTRYGVEVVEEIGPAWDAMAGQFADACLEQMAAYAVPRWDPSRLWGGVLREMGSGRARRDGACLDCDHSAVRSRARLCEVWSA